MSSKQKSNNAENLLAAIRQSPVIGSHDPETDPEPKPEKSTRTRQPKTPKSAALGKATQVWLYDEDRRLVRELAAWLAGQGIRSTDSTVIRAALRVAKTDAELLEAYRDAAQLDGRLKK